MLAYTVARHEKGIKVRLWMAVLSATAALLIDVFYIVPAYNSLPDEVPVLFDIYGKIAQMGDKSELGCYIVFRTAFFVIMTLIACGFYSIWHNLWNSYQIARKAKSLSDEK